MILAVMARLPIGACKMAIDHIKIISTTYICETCKYEVKHTFLHSNYCLKCFSKWLKENFPLVEKEIENVD